jgi:hypothetical protein
MIQLFDFVIEDSQSEDAHMNVYLVRQTGEEYVNKMVTLQEFKERFSMVEDLKQRVEMLTRIVQRVSRFHSECGGIPFGNISMNEVWIDSEDGEIYFKSFAFETTPLID